MGSSSYITNLDGDIAQHIEYVPFGEVFINEQNNRWNTPYLFNGKELDEETGLYYYGARYYNPRESVWLSVDPLAEKYPGVSPYCYTLNNPLKYIDPDGRDIILVIWTTGTGDNGVGHVGIAVSNYKEVQTARIDNNGNAVLDNDGNQVYDISYEKDGTYTFYENWPGERVDFDLKGAITSVEANRPITTISSEGRFTDGSTVSPYEEVVPNGVLKLSTSYKQDMAVKARLEKANEKKTNYNGAWYNCASFSSDGLKAIFGKKVGRESMLGPIKSITPNQLWKDTQKASEKKGINTEVLKDPGTGVDNKFKETMKGGN